MLWLCLHAVCVDWVDLRLWRIGRRCVMFKSLTVLCCQRSVRVVALCMCVRIVLHLFQDFLHVFSRLLLQEAIFVHLLRSKADWRSYLFDCLFVSSPNL